jgi:predicted amidophosphoribosyltransferase
VDDVFTSGSTLHNCFLALRTVFPPDVRISIATLAFVGGA